MQKITHYADISEHATEVLTLPFDIRQKARFKTRLDSGEDIGVTLPRGKILRGGDKLKTESGTIVEIKAASESVSTVTTTDALLLTRVCYHLGNRHVPLQIGSEGDADFCRYTHDHVLDDMVIGLGAQVVFEQAPFEPESGAYASGHSHAHSHSHQGEHSHSHG